MAIVGQIQGGVVVFEGAPPLAEGTVLRVEPVRDAETAGGRPGDAGLWAARLQELMRGSWGIATSCRTARSRSPRIVDATLDAVADSCILAKWIMPEAASPKALGWLSGVLGRGGRATFRDARRAGLPRRRGSARRPSVVVREHAS